MINLYKKVPFFDLSFHSNYKSVIISKNYGGGIMFQKYHIFFKSVLWMTGLSFIFLFFLGFSMLNMINTLFLVSLFFFCVYCFKWILDHGTFYTFQYSWQKTKRYVLFFLPKYWPTFNKKIDYDEQTGEKIYHSFEEFYEYKQSQKWEDINQLLCSTLVIIALSFMLSILYM